MTRVTTTLEERVTRYEEAWVMRHAGKKLDEIATRFGVTRERARQILKTRPRPIGRPPGPQAKKQ